MPANLVKFVYAASATADQIAAFSPDTIYFVGGASAGEGGKLYKGPRLYDSGAVAAAAELAQLKTYIGTLPVDEQYSDLIDYIDKKIADAQQAAEDHADSLNTALATVAHSGAAGDVSVADSGNIFTATNVEDVLAELDQKIGSSTVAGEVTMETASGSGDTLTVYSLYQGVTQSDDAATKASKKIGDINIPKDYLVKSATIEVVSAADTPYQGAEVGDKYIDFVINTKDGAGTGTAQHIYIALDDLVAVMSGGDTAEISVDIDSHNEITATVNKISGSKVIYRAASDAQGEPGDPDYVPAVAEQTVNAKLAELEQAIGDGIDALDGSATIATEASGVVTLKAGITETNGVISNNSASDITLAKVATTGSAQDISYGSSTAKAALDTIGTIPAGSSATTVVDYVDEMVGGGVGSLDADLDAALGAGDTDPEAIAVSSGITEVDGIITSVKSVAADAAGAATRAKAALIGQSSDAASANTIYGAKAYADAAVAALDADLDAALSVSDTDANAVAVVSGVTEVDGVITAVDSVAVDAAGSATTAEANARAYIEQCLTWGSLPAANGD